MLGVKMRKYLNWIFKWSSVMIFKQFKIVLIHHPHITHHRVRACLTAIDVASLRWFNRLVSFSRYPVAAWSCSCATGFRCTADRWPVGCRTAMDSGRWCRVCRQCSSGWTPTGGSGPIPLTRISSLRRSARWLKRLRFKCKKLSYVSRDRY